MTDVSTILTGHPLTVPTRCPFKDLVIFSIQYPGVVLCDMEYGMGQDTERCRLYISNYVIPNSCMDGVNISNTNI